MTSQTMMNACAFCKRGKRKCDKTRPSCSNCLRLGRSCVYTQDAVQTNFVSGDLNHEHLVEALKRPTLPLTDALSGVDPFNSTTLQQSTVNMVMQEFGSLTNLAAISRDFFSGTHQRLPAVSKLRFEQNLQFLTTSPRAGFAALCLSILLMQQTPMGESTSMQSSLYFKVKNLITLLETTSDLTLDLVHCGVLVTFYEMGHGLHRAAYLSLAGCARAARVLGLHKKRWRDLEADPDKLALEEEKRTWWSIVLMDRFINLCNGDAFFVTDNPARTDPLPVEDLLWSESLSRADLESLIAAAPLLDTPFNITVGQLARECQISHLVGHVTRHVYDPLPDTSLNTEEAIQLERTLKAYLPLLSNEELRIGKYCGAYGMCNSALFILYEYMLSRKDGETFFDRHLVLRSIEETARGALTFAEAAYRDQDGNYPPEIFSPYLPYSLCQAAIVHHRLWTQTGHIVYKQGLDTLKAIIRNMTKRWMVAWQYLDAIENLDESWPSIAVAAQGRFIGTEDFGHWSR